MTPYEIRQKQLERRRKAIDRISELAIKGPERIKTAGSGPYTYVVPYSPLEGISRLAQALVARFKGEALDKEEEELADEKRAAELAAMDKLRDKLLGEKTQTGGPLQSTPDTGMDYGATTTVPYAPAQAPSQYQPLNIEHSGKMDPMGAVAAAADPSLEGKNIQKVVNAMATAQAKGSGDKRRSYFTSVPGEKSHLIFDTRSGQSRVDDYPEGFVPYKADVDLKGRESYEKRIKDLEARLAKEPELKSNIKAAELKAENLVEAQSNLAEVKDSANYMKSKVEELITHPGREGVTGVPNLLSGAGRTRIWATDEADFIARLEQVEGKEFLQAYKTLKGGGQITEVEGKKATDALSRLSKISVKDEDYVEAAHEFIDEVDLLVILSQQKAGEQPLPQGISLEDIRETKRNNPSMTIPDVVIKVWELHKAGKL